MMRRLRRIWKEEFENRKARHTAVACAITLAAFASCRADPPRAHESNVTWKPIGSWSGRGDKQTETFTSDTGGFRVHWQATREDPGGGGRLRVVFRSGDSGREIIEAIDAHGAGSGVEAVAADRPRWYYLTIESANEDWNVSIDERVETPGQP
jgi:hypothetical protein